MPTRLEIYQQAQTVIDKAARIRHIGDAYLAKINQDELIALDQDQLVGVTVTSAQKKAALFPVFDQLVAELTAITDLW